MAGVEFDDVQVFVLFRIVGKIGAGEIDCEFVSSGRSIGENVNAGSVE